MQLLHFKVKIAFLIVHLYDTAKLFTIMHNLAVSKEAQCCLDGGYL